jgi:eukaryotic-like serine/threonine-protein kinase
MGLPENCEPSTAPEPSDSTNEPTRSEAGPGGPADSGTETLRWSDIDETITYRRASAGSSLPGLKATTGAARAATVVTTDEFVQSLIDVGLMEPDEIHQFLDQFGESERPKDVESLARRLVRARWLTEYQAGAVLQGKTKGLRIGNYCILEKLGAGGMGMVFKAEHRVMKRVVALKLLPPSFTRISSNIIRFQREAEAVARLSHPNVVAALDAGEFKGLHFFVMEYVEGKDLHRFVKENGPLPLEKAMTCLIEAARGMEAAHARGIFHRDIKPSNLLLEPGGTVKVLDLGLARFEQGSRLAGDDELEEGLTQHGDLMGTVDYMSPEQAYDSRAADSRSDIYSLGCTLYYLLVGHPPYSGSTVMARAIAHREQPVPRLRTERPDAPAALEALLLRMLAKKPEDRYSSIESLLDELDVCREAIAAARTNSRSKPILDPAVRGNFAAVRSGIRILVGIMMVLGVSACLTAWRLGLLQNSAPPRESAVVNRAARENGSFERRGPSTTQEQTTNQTPNTPSAPSPPPEVVSSSLRPATSAESTADLPPKAELASREPIHELRRFSGHPNHLVESVVVSSDGSRALSAGVDQMVRYWDVGGGEEIRVFRHDGPVFSVDISRDDAKALSASGDRTVRIWDTATGRELVRFEGHKQAVYSAAFSPNGEKALSGGRDNYARLWEVRTGSEIRHFEHIAPVVAVAFSPDDRSAVTASDATLTLWNLASGVEISRLEESAEISSVVFSPDGSRLLAGLNDGSISLWDVDRRERIQRTEVSGCWVRCVGFVPGSHLAVAGTQNGRFILWDLETSGAIVGARGAAGHLGIAFLPNGRHALTSDDDGFLRLWQLPTELPAESSKDPAAEAPVPK